MKRNAKRLCSLLLSLVMLVSLFGGTMMTAQAQGETITVYLDLGTSGWGQSMVYWWDSAETVDWPGISMNWVEGTIFTAEIPADARGVVFNDGSGKQSTDLHDPKDGDLFVVGTNDWFEAACNHEYMDGICIHCGEAEPVPVEECTVYFDLSVTVWEQVYIYWWRNNDTIGSWPGLPMTQAGGTVYSAQVPADVKGLLFTDGSGNKTGDLELPGDGYIYDPTCNQWTVYEGCAHEWDAGRVETEPTCTEPGLEIYTCLHCGETLTVDTEPYGHDWVEGTCSRCGEAEPVPVAEYTVYFDLGITAWEQVYFYWWRDGDDIGPWPGVLMTQEGGSVYSAQIPENVNGLLFTNGDGDQTSDLELPGDGYIYSKAAEDWKVHNGCSHVWDDGTMEKEPTCVERGTELYTCELCGETMTIEVYPYGHDWVDSICSRCGWDQNELCTIYFDMGFSNRRYVNIYWWADGEDSPAWPGVPMTYEGGSIYSAQIPSYATGVLFNDVGFKDPVGNTPDMELPGDGYVYRETLGQWALHSGCNHAWDGGEVLKRADCEENGIYIYTCANCDETVEKEIPAFGHSFVEGYCTTCGAEDPTLMYTVYYDIAFSERENVNIYWWADGETIGDWPGVPMIHEGGSIYSALVPAYATGLLFNDGETQTADLTLPGDGYVYRENQDEWVAHNYCYHEWDDGVMESGWICTNGGVCLHTCGNCGLSYTEDRAPADHNLVNGICTECGNAGIVGDLYYEISDGQVTITGCKNTISGKLVIPGTVAGYPVTAIGKAAFFGVPLTEVVIPDSVITIGEQAFMYCDRMARITLSNHLKVIGNSSFEGCTSLVKITIPNSVTDIGEQAFIGCVKLFEITIPEGVTSIGGCAFGVCQNLTEVTIPASVTNIGAYPFFDCLNLTRIQVAKENAYYCNDAYGVLLNKNKTKLIQAPPAGLHGSYAMADSVKTIAKRAFYGCTDVTELILPNGLTTIEDSGCYYMGLTKVIIPATVTTMDESAFGYCLSLQNIYFCGDAPVFGDNVFMWAHANVYYHQGTKGWPAQINDWYDTQLVWKEAHIYAENGSCMVCGEGDSTTGLVKLEDGCWWYVINGKVATDTTTLVKWGGEWWYVVNGKVASDLTTLVKYNNEWWYVVKGKIASNTTSLVKYNNEWWYVVKGKIASKTTTLVKYNNEWWYVVKGKIASKTTTLVKYNNEWWYVVNGKIASKTTTLVKYNNEWWYVVKGKIASKTTTLVQYNGGWYYLVKGKLAAKTTTLVKYNGGWYYVNKGSVDWSYTGNFTYNGGTYRIVKGRVA